MNVTTQFPSLIGAQALPALDPNGKPKGGGKLTHPLGVTKMKHPLAARATPKGGSKAKW